MTSRLALRESAAPCAVKIAPLAESRSLRSMPCLRGIAPDEQRVVGVPEGDVGVVAAHDAGEQRERAIVQLHGDALERAERGRDLEQLQDHRLVGTEELTAGDAWEEAIADLAGCTGDGDTNWGRHGSGA